MKNLKIIVKGIKNISEATFEFPLEKSLNLIVGANGSGKSTILLALSQAIARSSLKTLKSDDYSPTSSVEISLNGVADL